MKVLLSVLVFIIALTLSSRSVAEEAAGHGDAATHGEGTGEHHDLSAGHGSGKVFPPPAKDLNEAKAPGTVELVAPAFSSTVSGATTLQWKAAIDAENYHVQVAKDPNFKWTIVDEHLYNGTSFEVKNLEPGLHYYWRVAGSNQHKWLGSTHGVFTKSMFETK